MNSRTVRDLSVPINIWPIVESWAAAEGFRLIDDDGTRRRYQKGSGLIVLPTKLEISQSDESVHFEAWIQASFINRLFSLFLLPEEIQLDSGGLKAVIPRTVARDAINRLLIHLGQPLIT